ncbi:AbiV family abortive infection protein [Fodinibius sp. SL11]|uniref:AbiV family abortive infection protein n=1 Tax=Fodinibius sp. SL11 TaxID=3425690 RepID=UPI003F88234A
MSLSIEQITSARKKTFKNAEELIKDSELLFENGSFARSLFLSQIAVEELGKYLMICSIITQQIRNDDIDWSKFWKRFRSHIEKRGNIYNFGIFLSFETTPEEKKEQIENLEDDLEDLESEKLSSLYTDYTDNEFTLPSNLIDEETAVDKLENAKGVLDFFRTGEELFKAGDIKSIDPEKIKQLHSKLTQIEDDQELA